MNQTTLIGRLVRDPEGGDTKSGVAYSRFTIAVNREYDDHNADFINIIAWRNQANYVNNYIKKGNLVSVVGAITVSQYENKEGVKVTKTEVTAKSVKALESKAARGIAPGTPSDKTQEFKLKESQPDEVKFEKETKSDLKPWELDL